MTFNRRPNRNLYQSADPERVAAGLVSTAHVWSSAGDRTRDLLIAGPASYNHYTIAPDSAPFIARAGRQ